MIKIAICDDDYVFANQLRIYFNQIKSLNMNVNLEVEVFLSSTEILNALNEGKTFDVIFMDIQLPMIDGISLGKKVRSLFDTILIYMSVSNQYFVDLFSIKPFGFILKPISFENFYKVFQSIYNELYSLNDVFHVKSGKSIIRVKYKDIVYFKSLKRQIEIVTTDNETYKFYGKIPELYENIKHLKFIWIHKSYIINYDNINKITYDYVIMSNGEQLDISTRRKKEVRQIYMQLGLLGDI